MTAQPLVRLDLAPQEMLPVVVCLRQFPRAESGSDDPVAVRDVELVDEHRQRILIVEEREVTRQQLPQPVTESLRRPHRLPVLEHAFELGVPRPFPEELLGRDVNDDQPGEIRIVGQVRQEPLAAHSRQRELYRAPSGDFLPDVQVRIEQDA